MQTTTETPCDASRLDRCAGRLLGKLRRTARRWPVLPEGARLALAVSGGLDSLAMAYLVGEYNRSIRQPLELIVVHVRLDAGGVTEGLPARIHRWFDLRGLEVEEVSPRLEASEEVPLGCFACARARRRTLLEAAEIRGASHVALGHHADDVVETWLMSLMYTGTAEAMPPARSYFGGAVHLVRPLYELQRRELERLVRLAGIPEPASPCAVDSRTRRDTVRGVLAALGRDQSLVRRQLFWAAVRQVSEVDSENGANELGGHDG